MRVVQHLASCADRSSTCTCINYIYCKPAHDFRFDNDYAFYTTTPDELQVNLVKVTFDADGLWGFTMNLVDSPAVQSFDGKQNI